MNLKEMRAKVLEEMEHIPKHPKPEQSDLRMCYFTRRMHSLGKKAKEEKDATDVLQDCIEQLGADHPSAEFRYDEKFFKPKRKRRS